MLTLTNSYWCFFINESDMAQNSLEGIPIRTAKWNYAQIWLAGVYVIHVGHSCAFIRWRGRLSSWASSHSSGRFSYFILLTEKKTWINQGGSTQTQRQAVYYNKEWQGLIHLISVVWSQPPISMLLPGIPVLFPCKCPLCSVLVVAECDSSLHARPEGCGQCACPATLLWFPSKGHHSL